jgi:hypothetical protein
MKKLTLLLFLFAAFCSINHAQNAEETESTQPKLKYQAGAFAGISQGVGMSVRFWPEKFGAQFTFAPIVNENSEWYSLGFSLMHWISKSEKTRIYFYQGNHLILDIDKNILEPNGARTTKWDRQYSCGLGFGVQVNLVTRFKLDITTGFVATNNFQRLQRDIGIGLYYEF